MNLRILVVIILLLSIVIVSPIDVVVAAAIETAVVTVAWKLLTAPLRYYYHRFVVFYMTQQLRQQRLPIFCDGMTHESVVVLCVCGVDVGLVVFGSIFNVNN